MLSVRLSNSPWESDVPLFSSFSLYKEYIICLISFSYFSDVLSVFSCASAIGNPWSIC